MQFDKKRYKCYEEKLYSLIDEYSNNDRKINELFDELLTVLPNNGKLYKYKALKTFHIDELEEKYVWFCSAKKLNDNKDCSFNANSLEQVAEMIHFILTDNNFRKILAAELYTSLSKKNKNITLEVVMDCLNCVAKKGQKIGKLKFEKFCREHKLTTREREKISHTIDLYCDEKKAKASMKENINALHAQMQNVRNSMQVLSLTDSFNKDSMWAYYCDNKGICLEYDFNKIKSVELRKVFINTQKVMYKRKKRLSYVEIMKAKIENDPDLIIKADRDLTEQLLTKDKSWRAEEEWRVIINDKNNYIGRRVEANIVSAIYIDFSVLNCKKTRRAIRIAKENGWKVFVRYFDYINSEYRYDTIKNIRALIKKTKQVVNVDLGQ